MLIRSGARNRSETFLGSTVRIQKHQSNVARGVGSGIEDVANGIGDQIYNMAVESRGVGRGRSRRITVEVLKKEDGILFE